MGRLIDADTVVHWQSYDDEHETFPEHTGTISDFLDTMTDEGCPEAVDAVPVRRGHWKEDPSGYGFWICSHCGFVSEASAANMLYKFCPVCGALMEGKDGDHNDKCR